MPKTERTPPAKSKLTHGQSLSESDLTSAASQNNSGTNVTMRSKRQRPNDSPNQGSNVSLNKDLDVISLSAFLDFKKEVLEMLTKWKTEHDNLLTSWKTEQDIVLSKLVSDVSNLRTQCLSIQTTNAEIEHSMSFINKNYEDMASRIKSLEGERTENAEYIRRLQLQIQDLNFQTRQSTIEIRNCPLIENEKPDDLISVVSTVAKVVNMDIQVDAIRDVYRIPGKPGICRPIVAELRNVNVRNDLLARLRKYNKEHPSIDKLNTRSIGITGDKKPIYVDEYLPPSVKKLMYDTRQFAKSNNYSSWFSNGRILLRREKDEKPFHIKSGNCIKQLISNK